MDVPSFASSWSKFDRLGIPCCRRQATGRRAVDIAKASSLPSDSMAGLLRTIQNRLTDAERDNNSVYMQPRVAVAKLPAIAQASLAKVGVRGFWLCVYC